MTTFARTGKALIDATRPFAHERRGQSWFHVITTFGALLATMALAAAAPFWPLRIAAAALEALLLVRAFILYHDYLHGALLRGSPLAALIFHLQGVLMLTPPRVWTDTHNFHHANTARLGAPAIGTYVLWSVERWRAASWRERLLYRLERHPITMLFGQVTVFFFGMCVIPFARDPRRYASSGLAALVHIALWAVVWRVFGPGVLFCALVGPHFVACALGAYLFYAQHNSEGLRLRAPEAWSYAEAATEGSTYMATGPVMRWFTGNIGYHHVHHLNARIPFYRLPEAMAALPELQNPVVTTLRPRDVLACLRLALWDPVRGRMISLREVRTATETALAVAT